MLIFFPPCLTTAYCYPDVCSSDLVLVRQTMTWFEGQAYCRGKHTDLATIHGPQDVNKVIDVMGMDVSDVWIGLYKDGATWKWSDGSDSIFRHWGQGDLNNSGAGPNCAHFDGSLKIWRASPCDTKSKFLCYCEYYKTSLELLYLCLKLLLLLKPSR